MDTKEKLALIYLTEVRKFSPKKINEGISSLGSAVGVCEKFFWKEYMKSKISWNMVFLGDKNYSNNLSNINDPPYYYFYKGDISLVNKKCVSIVGTRNMTPYGKQVTIDITKKYIRAGFVIVSGLAKGIDSVAHKTALENSGKTIAVMGTDVDTPYPQENSSLYDQIVSSGCIISENRNYSGYSKWLFPQRNRLIAGLSSEIIVVEAKEKSGALITANYAFQYNRKLVAVPGNIYSKTSCGCHKLIYQNKAEIYYDDQKVNKENHDIYNLTNQINKGFNTIELIVGQTGLSEHIIKNLLNDLESKKIIAKDFFGSYIVLD